MSFEPEGGGRQGPGRPGSEPAQALYTTRWYNPSFRVRLLSRDTGKDYGFDINEDIRLINTSKSLGSPAGMWALTVTNRPLTGDRTTQARTWAEVARPMDYVEIAFSLFRNRPPVTVMRGFVDNTRYVDSLDQEGRPSRRVLISGRDFGKLWLKFKIFYLVELSQYVGGDVGLLEQFYDFPFKFFTPNEFFTTVADRLLLKFLAKLRAQNPAIPDLAVRPAIPDIYQVNPVSADLMSFQGPVYNLMMQFASQPYTECFFRDQNDGPEWLWRWAPLLKAGNVLPMSDHASHPGVKTVHAGEIVEHDMGRSDNATLNYLWAPPTVFGGTGSQEMKVIAPGYIDRPSIDLFGFADFQPPFNLYRLSTGDPKHEQALTETVWGGQIQRLTEWLAWVYRDGEKFFEGQINSHMRPDILIGDYCDLPEFGQRCYVESVEHNFVVGDANPATTALTLTRGRGLDDAMEDLPGSYRFDPAHPNEVPGISSHGAAPSRSAAGQADKGAPDPATDKNTQPGSTVPADIVGGARIAAVARTLVGAPYEHANAWQQDDPAVIFKQGIDCSQLVSYCYRLGVGKSVPAHAQTQYDTMSRVANAADLAEGDALFFSHTVEGTGEFITHSAIYVGNGELVSADDYPTGVRLHKVGRVLLDDPLRGRGAAMTGVWQQGLGAVLGTLIDPHKDAGAIRAAKVVGANWEDHTVDIAWPNGGGRTHVPVMEMWAGSDYGDLWHPQHAPADPNVPEGAAQQTGRDTYCLVAFINGVTALPIVIGFFFPEVSAMMHDNFQHLTRYANDTYSGVSKDGDHYLAFDAHGAFVGFHKPGSGQAPSVRGGSDYDRRAQPGEAVRSFTTRLPVGSTHRLDGATGDIQHHAARNHRVEAARQLDLIGDTTTIEGLPGLLLGPSGGWHSGFIYAPSTADDTTNVAHLTNNAAHDLAVPDRGLVQRDWTGWRYLQDGPAMRAELALDGTPRYFTAPAGRKAEPVTWTEVVADAPLTTYEVPPDQAMSLSFSTVGDQTTPYWIAGAAVTFNDHEVLAAASGTTELQKNGVGVPFPTTGSPLAVVRGDRLRLLTSGTSSGTHECDLTLLANPATLPDIALWFTVDPSTDPPTVTPPV
jgi:cell wall-associated NlpC family hydrolase